MYFFRLIFFLLSQEFFCFIFNLHVETYGKEELVT